MPEHPQQLALKDLTDVAKNAPEAMIARTPSAREDCAMLPRGFAMPMCFVMLWAHLLATANHSLMDLERNTVMTPATQHYRTTYQETGVGHGLMPL